MGTFVETFEFETFEIIEWRLFEHEKNASVVSKDEIVVEYQ